jgi:glucosamine--fructose-6-phosphate aminotransferase (isomerizing)
VRDARHVVIAARGSSDNAARYAQYVFGAFNRLTVALATPSLFTRYQTPPRMDGALVIGISQSGQAADIIEVVTQAKGQGALTLAITNFGESPLAAVADCIITLEAGAERAVAATKTYTAQLMALALLTATLSEKQHVASLQRAPDAVAEVLALKDTIRQAVERYRYMQHGVVLGRGYNYATAFEIALKLKETCYLAAEPYSPADFLHGPVALVEAGFLAIMLAPSGAVSDNLAEFIPTLRSRGASILAVSDQEASLRQSDVPLRLPVVPAEWTSPLVTVIPGQLLAFHLAQARGLDPDKPRGLKKVTVTR